jgi:hypothetical protein
MNIQIHVFVSSTIYDLNAERNAAEEAIKDAGMVPVMSDRTRAPILLQAKTHWKKRSSPAIFTYSYSESGMVFNLRMVPQSHDLNIRYSLNPSPARIKSRSLISLYL